VAIAGPSTGFRSHHTKISLFNQLFVELFMRISNACSLIIVSLALPLHASAGLLDQAKSLKAGIDKAANTPIPVSISKGSLQDNAADLNKVFGAFKKKIGANPLMVYGASIGSSNDAHITYQSPYNPEKLESLHFIKNEIQGKATKFTLTGTDAKVANSVFDFSRVNLSLIPGLVQVAREKTALATKGNKTLGSSVKIVQLWTPGKPTQIRLMVTVASDDGKSSLGKISDALDTLKDTPPPKGSTVGRLVADETGKVIEFRLL
jgi:hypothetical protein